MRISSFGQNNIQQSTGFKFANSKNEASGELKTTPISADDLEPRKISKNSIEYQLENTMRESSKFLKDGLDKIFDNGEKLLAGRNSAEYEQHINDLSKAIQSQDFKSAEALIDRFYNGDTSKIITRVENLAKAAEDNFWQTLEDNLGFLKNDGLKWTMYVDGKERDDLSTLDLAMMAIEKSRTEVDKFSSEDLSDLVSATRDGAVAHAKSKLDNAGQNKYSEDAASVTHAATDYAKGKIFRTDDSNYAEDEEVLKDIDELYHNEGLSEEQMERLRHQNTRKADKFTAFMRGRTESFEEEFSRLKLEASPRVVEKVNNPGKQSQTALTPIEQQLKSGIDPNLLHLSPQNNATRQAIYSPVKITELYGNEKEAQFNFQRNTDANVLNGWI
ncbi:hypothetical protein [Desulfovibrio sp. JC010]|uniref:hypothetical protein n=1 Tax=Desulfovibrio sp. JC010 TaxID=2593641 RepID=UPI0013D1CBF1|nr:hypothetical protein [Desulfovibrio sp. JC010]NDV25297.1 hypothetical protein [Desulfovibrio sp. JC010]